MKKFDLTFWYWFKWKPFWRKVDDISSVLESPLGVILFYFITLLLFLLYQGGIVLINFCFS